MTAPLEIAVQGTPNPNAMKVTLNRVVATHGTTYRDSASAETLWAQQLLQIPGVIQLFAINNFISISKTPDADWQSISPQVERVLKQSFA